MKFEVVHVSVAPDKISTLFYVNFAKHTASLLCLTERNLFSEYFEIEAFDGETEKHSSLNVNQA